MLGILRGIFNNRGHRLVWAVVISAILFNLGATRYELTSNLDLIDHPFYGFFLSPFSDIRYGHYIARKLFLPVIAFFILGYWLTRQKNIGQAIQKNLKYVFYIGSILLVSRILTFGFWFYNDDLRFFHFHLFAPTQPGFNPQASWGPIGLHPIAIFLLVMRWFGTNYTLYNILGLFFFFLVGIAIFALINKLQENKSISLIAAVFFLTIPTYFQGRLLIGEIINSPFIFLLVILSIYLLLQRFIPGALIFAAAALEYGVAKSYFIAFPLTLTALFFVNSGSIWERVSKNGRFIASIWLISLVYLPTLFGAPSAQGKTKTLALDQLFVWGDVLMSVTLPYVFTYPLVHLLSLILEGWVYITAALGFLTIAAFFIVAVVSYIRKKKFSTKLVVLALSIVLPTSTIASFMGVRVDHNVQKLVEYSNKGAVPSGATGYGIFPALGVTFLVVAMAYLMKRKAFKVFAFALIMLNIVGSISADYRWLKSPYAYPQRRYDEQLQVILPKDGLSKYVFISDQQRQFFEGVRTFASVFRGDNGINTFMGIDDFVETLQKGNVSKERVYFLVASEEPEYHIYDHSSKIREIPLERLAVVLDSLSKELSANPAGL